MLGGWCMVVCVVLWGSCGCETAQCQCKPRCVDLDRLDQLLDMNTTRSADLDSRIFLARSSFIRIRENPKLHACVVMEVLTFYQSLMNTTSENKDLLYFLNNMKRCVPQVDHQVDQVDLVKASALQWIPVRCKYATFCSELKTDSRRAISSHSIKGSRNMALLQISKLDQASHKLNNRLLQEEAMAELRMLKYYIRGRGFRLYELKKKKP